jgi:hypothetical protein
LYLHISACHNVFTRANRGDLDAVQVNLAPLQKSIRKVLKGGKSCKDDIFLLKGDAKHPVLLYPFDTNVLGAQVPWITDVGEHRPEVCTIVTHVYCYTICCQTMRDCHQ